MTEKRGVPEVGVSGGIACCDDGCVTLTQSEASALYERAMQAKREREQRMPDEKSSIRAMCDAYVRLIELGWRNAIYCPKDGTHFQVIEAGSSGIHEAYYSGEWPTGGWWIVDRNDNWPSRPVLFRDEPATHNHGATLVGTPEGNPK